jgi:D-amino peptidase
VFLSGDDKACAEAKALIPDIVTVETKKGLGVELALHLSVEASRKAIRAGVAQAVKSARHIPRLMIAPPYELEIRVQEGYSINTYLEYGMERIDAQTVIKRGNDLIAVFQ